jgi:hypothetical protein
MNLLHVRTLTKEFKDVEIPSISCEGIGRLFYWTENICVKTLNERLC